MIKIQFKRFKSFIKGMASVLDLFGSLNSGLDYNIEESLRNPWKIDREKLKKDFSIIISDEKQ